MVTFGHHFNIKEIGSDAESYILSNQILPPGKKKFVTTLFQFQQEQNRDSHRFDSMIKVKVKDWCFFSMILPEPA